MRVLEMNCPRARRRRSDVRFLLDQELVRLGGRDSLTTCHSDRLMEGSDQPVLVAAEAVRRHIRHSARELGLDVRSADRAQEVDRLETASALSCDPRLGLHNLAVGVASHRLQGDSETWTSAPSRQLPAAGVGAPQSESSHQAGVLQARPIQPTRSRSSALAVQLRYLRCSL